MSTKELQQTIAGNMKQWQKIEKASVVSTAHVLEKTDNPIVRLIMEIIQRDSQMHYRIQELIVDSFEKKAISLSTDELAAVWGLVEKHIELEKQTVKFAEEALAALKGKKMVVQEYLLNYLLTDEKKHNTVLSDMEKIKKGMYPYG
ncbi:MAG: hypothetical protein A2161_21100 [Candidatus Schekmanbacteria bacterium RBG_13_48_7]|uniref:Rubrerythrin diiron-binding domain-containing protein n=1 Tax=Candidatus Schekmanbacteria bacterium RBG_13_48_7 TaxID=1817878 RepID=A0A1F7RLG8_9BACT|nr:MAG: hypothetical protein A2161_21100 [Candidatus Schekmanbacteria bacterium RBG_13_48_7]